MKKLFILLTTMLSAASLSAQQSDSLSTETVAMEPAKERSMKYDRSSLAMAMIIHPEDEFGGAIDSAYHAMPFPDKYDDHSIGVSRIDNRLITGVQRQGEVGLIKAQYGKRLNANDLEKNATALENLLNESRIANYMIAKWFGLYDGDVCHMGLIQERGQYNATELDVALANQSARGLALLSDAGENLIGNTYMLVHDMTYATAEERAAAAKIALSVLGGLFDAITGGDLGSSVADLGGAIADGFTGFAVKNHSYLFRLDWNEELANIFYDEYYMTEPDPVKLDKFLKDERFVLKFVAHEFESSEKTVAKGKKVDREKVIKMVCTRSIDKNIASLQLQYEDFKVKTPIYEEVFNEKGKSIGYAVKIGLKEGIDEKSSFQVVRKIEDPTTHKTKYRYVANLRPVKGKVWDNRYMAAEEDEKGSELSYTLMKKVSGGEILPGMLVIEGKYSKVVE